ncbi:hypothetical protein ABZT17_20955 [Streptomyces sp. NPDC005648]|uniref:hypothetical protein n=1 Tax=Streptomyces sp. NPDC005648 TaxID=3157044 RepID=UPI0033A4B9C5
MRGDDGRDDGHAETRTVAPGAPSARTGPGARLGARVRHADLPPLPNPDRHGKPGRSGHSKDDGLPGPTTGAKNA